MFNVEYSGYPLEPIWVPVDGTSTIYIGQIVTMGLDTPGDSGCTALGVASGKGNLTNKDIPYGVVIGTNNRPGLYNSTYMTEYITGVNAATQISRGADNWTGQEGMYVKGDPQALVQVARITPDVAIRGTINGHATTAGTAIVATTIATWTSGAAFTLAATCGFTPIAYNSTLFIRDGANAGIYRITSDTDPTTKTCVRYFPATSAVGDGVSAANIRVGTGRMQFDTTSQWIDNTAALTADWYTVITERISLKEVDKAYAIFRFSAINFLGDIAIRATA